MPRRPAPLPRALLEGSFHVQTAREHGLTPARLRSSDLEAPFHGIRTAAATSDVVALAMAYAPLLRPGQYFSHTTAAALLSLRLPAGQHGGELHVTSRSPLRAPRSRGVIGHRATSGSVLLVNGLPVSGPVTTWCDLGTMLTVRDLVIVGDGLVERRRALATTDALSAAVDACAGRRGCRRLEGALPRIRPGTDSPMETVLRLLLIEAGLPEPVVNAPIRNRYGAVIAHADLAYPAQRVAIEYDGGHHRTDERQYNIDIDRLDELMEEGWRVIRVNRNLLARRATLVGKVRTALNEADQRRPPSPR